MATTTHAKQKSRAGDEPMFAWSKNHAGALVGAAVAGAAVGAAANLGRKFFTQMASAGTDWAESLKAEHDMTLALFDKLEATEDNQTSMRSHLLAKIKHALAKHAAEEEMAVYPALREAGETAEADKLNADHGYVKTYLYELETMANDNPSWMARVRDFRKMLAEHMREEETDIFPKLRARLSEEANTKLATRMNKEGFIFA
ncbi:hemerythrin domain-containing protein [Allosphingosinicella humi]|jgi:hemerythrin superfamily protein